MNPLQADEFTRIVHAILESWFRRIARDVATGKLVATGPFSYPNFLRIAETPNHFIAELCGAFSPHHPTAVRLRKPKSPEQVASATDYFNGGFETDPPEEAQFIATVGNTLKNLTLSTPHDANVLAKKVAIPVQPTILTGCRSSTPLGITSEADKLCLRNIDIVRTDAFRVVFRTICTGLCVRKDITSSELERWIWNLCDDRHLRHLPFGLNLGPDTPVSEFARQLASLSDENVKEGILDEFIQAHGIHFQIALGYQAFRSQPELNWVSRGSLDPSSSIPDYLLQRPDGYWDIVDLKRAALKFKSVVLGLPSRPRFRSYVAEMIAQLVKYREYFNNPENARWAHETLGVRVNRPKLVGVVGNFDTFVHEEVDAALKQYSDDLVILSYSDVTNLLWRGGGAATADDS